jgi:hypothetical protein
MENALPDSLYGRIRISFDVNMQNFILWIIFDFQGVATGKGCPLGFKVYSTNPTCSIHFFLLTYANLFVCYLQRQLVEGSLCPFGYTVNLSLSSKSMSGKQKINVCCVFQREDANAPVCPHTFKKGVSGCPLGIKVCYNYSATNSANRFIRWYHYVCRKDLLLDRNARTAEL